MAKAVLFDAAGTLFRLRVPVGAVYLRQAHRFGFDSPDATEEALSRSFMRVFRNRPPLAFGMEPRERIAELEANWWRQLVRDVFEPFGAFPRFDEFFESLFQEFATSEHWELEPGCSEVLVRLRQAGIRLAVVSNFDSRLLSVLAGLGIAGFFDAILPSSRCPAAKPDPDIFLAACRRLAVPPSESLHVGDSPVEDVQAAKAAGLRGILYDPQNHYASFEGERVASLSDLLRLVEE